MGGDDRFDLFAGPSQLTFKEFNLDGIDPEALTEPITFEFSTTVPMQIKLE